MKLKHLLLTSIGIVALTSTTTIGQTFLKTKSAAQTSQMPAQRTCGTDILPQQFEAYVQQWMSNMSQYKTAAINYTIPVIIHIIHNGEAVGTGANISNAQAISQITVLNQDYQGMNADSSLIPSVFKPAFAHSGIYFCLAKTDPSGNPLTEQGVDRINRNTKGWSAPPYNQTYIDGTIKPNSIWDPNQYLNIWCMSLGSSLLGYATFPNPGTSGLAGLSPPYGSATTDGVVILNTAFGNTGTAAAPYNKGRTATHEVGHWLGLRHIWGDGTCATDYCADTPPAQTSNGGCPTHPYKVGTCSGNTTGEMFMNYMDYVNDACMYMFSNDQKARMVAILGGSTMRMNLTASTRCNPTATLDAGIASIITPANNYSSCSGSLTPKVVLTNYGSTTLTSCTINYKYDAGGNQTQAWSGSLATGASATITLPSTIIAVGNHSFTANTSSPNGGVDGFAGNDQKINTFTITTAPAGSALPFFEGFEGVTFVPAGWQYTPANPPYSWSRTTACSGFGTSTACAKMDHYSSNNPINGQIDIMRTPPVNCSSANSTLKMYWEHAYAKYAAGDLDSLIIEASTDCGGTWTRIFGNGGTSYTTAPTTTSNFVPTIAQWKKDSISLSAYAGQSVVYFRFKSISDWGNNLYIDNINIKLTSSGPIANFSVNPNPLCAGQTVTVTNMSTGSPTAWSYTMTGGSPATSTATNPVVTYSAAGVYSITLIASNATGTSTPITKTVTVNPVPSITVVANPTAVCAGSSATISSSGATTYTLNTGATGANIVITPSVSATYTVTGSSLGCSNTKTVSITVNPVPVININPPSATVCANGTVSLFGSGASTYTWNTGANTSSLTVTPSVTTTYTLNGTNASGCVGSKTINVTVNPLPTVTITANPVNICPGSSSTLTANASGTGPFTYSWSTGATTAVITSSIPNIYTATVTNGNGCKGVMSYTLGSSAGLSITAVASQSAICAGGSTTLTASGATTYSWNTGGSTSAIVVSPSATTTYSVTGNTGACNGSQTVSVIVNSNPVVTATTSAAGVCPGSSAVLTASGASTYSWSTGASTSTVNVTPSSTSVYTVTGTSAGCSSSATVMVTAFTNPVATSTGTNVTCFGTCNGTSTVFATAGTPPYSYALTPGACTTPGCANLCAGTYSYIITDSNGCIGMTFVTIGSPAALSGVLTGSNASCGTCSDGTVTSSITGGTPSYSYLWSPGGATTPNLINVLPGCYTLTVTDASLCSTTYTTCIGFGSGINAVASSFSGNVYILPNPNTGVFKVTADVENTFDLNIYNAIGQLIKTETNIKQSTVVDLSAYGHGLYNVILKADNSYRTIKVIVD